MASIKYPVNVKSNNDRYAYLYRLQELLRLEHNDTGTDFREEKITDNDWDLYKESFEIRSELISEQIRKYRELLKNNTSSKAALSDMD